MARAKRYVPVNLLTIPNRAGTSMKNSELFVNAARKHGVYDQETGRV